MRNRLANLDRVWVTRNCDVCDKTFEPTTAGQGACEPCETVRLLESGQGALRDRIVEDANDAIQERIDYYDQQLDLIKDAIDDKDYDLAREHISDASAEPKLRHRQKDPRFLDGADYLVS